MTAEAVFSLLFVNLVLKFVAVLAIYNDLVLSCNQKENRAVGLDSLSH